MKLAKEYVNVKSTNYTEKTADDARENIHQLIQGAFFRKSP